jgi:hypothetical protein
MTHNSINWRMDKEVGTHSHNRTLCGDRKGKLQLPPAVCISPGFFCFYFGFLVALGFELRASHLLGRCSTA